MLYTAGFGHNGKLYNIICTEQFKENLSLGKQFFVFSQLIDGTWKILTRVDDPDLKEWIFFSSLMKDELFEELSKRKEALLSNDDPLFLEMYRNTRSVRFNGFVVHKFMNIIKEWREKGRTKDIDYFYQGGMTFHGLDLE